MKGKSTKWYNCKSLRFSKGAIIHPKKGEWGVRT